MAKGQHLGKDFQKKIKEKYGEDHHRNIGSKGGSATSAKYKGTGYYQELGRLSGSRHRLERIKKDVEAENTARAVADEVKSNNDKILLKVAELLKELK